MLVTREDQNGVSTLTLNRPDKLNAINPALMVELREHLEAIASDDGVGCVIFNDNNNNKANIKGRGGRR